MDETIGVERPLQNVRVIDHTIAWAGPQGSLVLADLGAEVIKIETCDRPDGMRGGLRFINQYERFWEVGPWFLQVNRNKLAITLDLGEEAGREVYLALVRVSDVIIDNFTPRVMPNLGLGYERLSRVNPGIIQVRLPGYGCTGPYKDAPAYGDCINAFSGLDDVTGYLDGSIMRPGIAYGDPTSGFAAAFGVLAALHHRSLTGRGQFIDVSHFEACSKAMDGLLDYAMNGRVQRRLGNRDPFMAPQGCYPCRGEDQWVVITIAGDDDWAKFRRVLGDLDWATDPRYATLQGRREHHAVLDEHIATWTSGQDRYAVTRLLQEAGIAAAPVISPGELLRDEQFVQRGFFEETVHPVAGTSRLPGMLFKLSETPCGTRSPAPLFGQHNQYVFRDLLGLSDAEIADLTSAGIVGDEPAYAKLRGKLKI